MTIKTYNINEVDRPTALLRLIIDTTQIKEDGSFYAYTIGNLDNLSGYGGLIFLIDENTANQIEKLKVVVNGFTPVLEVKDGEVFEESAHLTSVEEKIKLLEEELAKEKAKIKNNQEVAE